MTNDTIPLLEETEEILAARAKWQFTGKTRPEFAETPGVNQESVWDYPRPPVIEDVNKHLEVRHNSQVIAATTSGKRVLETAGAPAYYFHSKDINRKLGEARDIVSTCEWKGLAQAITIDGAEIGWRYVQMFPAFKELYLWMSFYPSKVDCYLDNQLVQAQPGGYYGGWVTNDLVGPIKGNPGSQGW